MTIKYTEGWHWELNDGDHHVCLELYDADKNLLAHISERPGYCDRGHFLVLLESRNLSLDEADGRSLMYYMDLEAAMWETVEFLLWRMHKVSYQHPKGGIRTWAKENMPAGRLIVGGVEYRHTIAPHTRDDPGFGSASVNVTLPRPLKDVEVQIDDSSALTVDAIRDGMAVMAGKLTQEQMRRREELLEKLKQPFIGYFRITDIAMPYYKRFVHEDGREPLDITDDEVAELKLEAAVEETIQGIIERAGDTCCKQDTDGDGNCPIHKAPGEFRTGGGR